MKYFFYCVRKKNIINIIIYNIHYCLCIANINKYYAKHITLTRIMKLCTSKIELLFLILQNKLNSKLFL